MQITLLPHLLRLLFLVDTTTLQARHPTQIEGQIITPNGVTQPRRGIILTLSEHT